MNATRVDKGWRQRGLQAYASADILGTLSHYGIELTEERFRQLSLERYPLAIANQWMGAWRGVGQFATFPIAAAEELWGRANPDRLLPTAFARAFLETMSALEGEAGAARERLDGLMGMSARLPLADGRADRVDEGFVDEVFFHMHERGEAYDALAESLAKSGRVEEAQRVAQLQERLAPESAGVMQALVKAAAGDKPAAVAGLAALAARDDLEGDAALAVSRALLRLGEDEPALQLLKVAFDRAERGEDVHLALEVGEELAELLERHGSDEDLEALEPRLERLEATHAAMHPEHAH